ncbi:solute carrier organic anion transporter family member 4C1-like [Ptychodera flava]|uniref:solute carrier organic anion transporter family member 4C1-like n=1 Tax=Ptychodera flava TaxID=63121 RepID=UPI00396A1A9A
MYTGTFFSIFGIGPIVGMPMASYFINLYVDFYRVDPADVDLHPSDPRWVGAWWLGYLLLSVPIMILAFLVSFVPKRMPVKTDSQEKPDQSAVQDNKTAGRKFKEFPKALGRICSNVTLMAVIFARAAMMANQGAITFIVKFTEEQFRVTTTISGIVKDYYDLGL